MRTLISIQAINYIYKDFVADCLARKIPVQAELSESQLEKIFGIVKSASNAVFGKKLYPSVIHQAVFILYQLNKQHILTDGNKRFSLLLALYILDINQVGYAKMNQEDWEMLVMRIASDPVYSLSEAIAYIRKKLK